MTVANIINYVYKNRLLILSGVCILLLMLLLNQCRNTHSANAALKLERQRSEQNIKALTENVQVYKNKASEISYKKAIADMNIDELKKNYNTLFTEFQKEKGKIRTIIKTSISYQDTGSIKNTVADVGGGKYSVNFSYQSSDSIAFIKGRNEIYAKAIPMGPDSAAIIVSPHKTYIDNLNIRLSLTTGVKTDNDGIDRIFITPSSSKIIVTDIQGADVSNYMKEKCKDYASTKVKRWGIGPYIGGGINLNGHGGIGISPQIGIGLHYSVIRF